MADQPSPSSSRGDDHDTPGDAHGARPGINDRELKLTAALYTLRKGVLDHVRETGELPSGLGPMYGGEIALRLIIEKRGTDIVLSEDEQLVMQAMLRGRRLPYGHAALVQDHVPAEKDEEEHDE